MTAIFSSRARSRVLRVLHNQEEPVPLRHVAYLAQMPVFSIQRALQQLVEENLVIQKRKKRFRLFSLNRNHLYHSFLSRLFDVERRCQAEEVQGRYDQRAKGLLDFVASARNLFKTAKVSAPSTWS